ncbi:molybdopterin-dependent oxidoreductase [Streptomyces sp. NPDC006385]|uniref:molybdopterin-dependent oxidoreductase n=1 Tax=Streptomyces sp. NPDC006385 TaxID=3156761 RepID=UPI0033B1E4A5
MTDTRIPPAPPAEPGAELLKAGRFFLPGTAAPDPHRPGVGPDRPDHEPFGSPGAALPWELCSPTRIRRPYVRGVLLEMYREAKQRLRDPVPAWADIQDDPGRRRRYQRARGKGGLVRASWDEAIELVAAAYVHTLRTYGPDRVAGWSPAMPMVSQAACARFHCLIGAPMLSFHDWCADLPVAFPQVFGDQADGPEAGDCRDAAYLMMWGSNAPVTETSDAYRTAEARYRGQKVVVVAPDRADDAKFADECLHPRPGTDGALALAMGHVILKEFFVDRETPFFADYVRKFTDLPFLVTLEERDGAYVPAKFLRASHVGQEGEGAEWKTVVLDEVAGRAVAPNGSLGFRWTRSGKDRWNLELGDIRPRLSLYGSEVAAGVEVLLPRFDTDGGAHGQGRGDVVRRGVPATKLGGVNGPLVTTVFDLLLAQYGVARPGLPGHWPVSYDDADAPGTPAWQEAHTSVPAARCVRIAREFARTADRSKGRCMILMGAGTTHWFHSETMYRAFLALLQLTGCPGRDGGGWAHRAGQDRGRPVTGGATLASASDRARPPRRMSGTAYWFLHTDQWRYDRFTADMLASPLGAVRFRGMTGADCLALSARSGWMPSYPTFDRNPLELGAVFGDPVARVVAELRAGTLRFACEDPDAPENWPRVLTLWRADLLGSSAQGAEFFTRHLLGTDSSPRAEEAPEDVRPRDVIWREEAPEGKLDLLLSLDFRHTSSTLLSDVVLPAAWDETDTFKALAERFSELAVDHLGVRKDLVATPLEHDTPGEIAQPGGVVLDWKRGECDPVPGRTLPNLTVVERDYTAIGARFAALEPLVERPGPPAEGISGSGGRRRAAFTLHTEHLQPWHTLTGRQHFFLDHDWIHEIGEALPVYRPPLDRNRLLGEPRLGPDGQQEVTVRCLTPHDTWSLHSEYQDDLFMLALSRGGRHIWLSPRDAEVIGVVDDDWVEAVGRGGVVVARAAVSHRIPHGTVHMHHAREHTIAVPEPDTTRLILKPSRLVGGYAQLTWAFNYLDPTGNQRDEVTVIRRRSQEVEY